MQVILASEVLFRSQGARQLQGLGGQAHVFAASPLQVRRKHSYTLVAAERCSQLLTGKPFG